MSINSQKAKNINSQETEVITYKSGDILNDNNLFLEGHIEQIKLNITMILSNIPIIEVGNLVQELDKLKNIQRFNGIGANVDDTVYYHTIRICTFINKHTKILSEHYNIDSDYLLLLALLHDLPENVTGDIPSNIKVQLGNFTNKSIKLIEKKYLKKIGNNTDLKGYNIDNIIHDLNIKNSTESQLLKLLDLLDGFYYYYYNLYSNTNENNIILNNYLTSINNYISILEKSGFIIKGNIHFVNTILDTFYLWNIKFLLDFEHKANSKKTIESIKKSIKDFQIYL